MKEDLVCILILSLIFVPLYTLSLYTVPFQINTDEITIMMFSKDISSSPKVDLFGISNYFDFPNFIFWLYGSICKFLGGVNLYNMRLINATAGVLIILASFFLFKLLFKKSSSAFFASLVLGSNHALLALSRMAMRDNSGLLVEIVSLTLLLRGLYKKNLIWLFVGALISGLSFYVYFPVRVIIGIWLIFLILELISVKENRTFVMKALIVSLVGFGIVILPIMVNTFREPPENFHYQKEQLLIFEEGRKLQQSWVVAPNIFEGIKINIVNGLTLFNNNHYDYGYIYSNLGHGFFDPLTGVLIWLGIFSCLIQLFKTGKISKSDTLNLTGLFGLVFIFSFITTKTPNYTRLLIILPFSSYFVLRWINRTILLLVFPTVILLSNLTIFRDFVLKGQIEGNDVGGTARYIEARSRLASYNFYLAADKIYQYYNWGEQNQWKNWVGFFASENQKVAVLSPSYFIDNLGKPPFSVFMSKSLWLKSRSSFILRYPNFTIHNIKPDGSLVAIEVI